MQDDTSESRSSTRPGALSPLDWARQSGAVDPVLRSVQHHVRRRRCRAAAATVGVCTLVVALFSVWHGAALRSPAQRFSVATARVVAPERRALVDGSLIEAQRDTVLEISYRADVRHVRLHRGTAHFEVASDPQRPFIVEAAGVGVRAVGTAFVVQLAGDAVDVLVTEGRVAVTGAPSPGTPTHASVGAGEHLLVSPGLSVQPAAIREEEMRDRLAWRVPRLEFAGAPLSEVVTLFNAHASGRAVTRLALADSDLNPLPLSGVLRADNVAALLSILETSYGLKSRRGSDGELVIYRP